MLHWRVDQVQGSLLLSRIRRIRSNIFVMHTKLRESISNGVKQVESLFRMVAKAELIWSFYERVSY